MSVPMEVSGRHAMSVPMEVSGLHAMSVPMEVSGRHAMSVTMEVSAQGFDDPSVIPGDKILVPVEVCLKSSSTAQADDVKPAMARMLEKRSLSYTDGPIQVPTEDAFLADNVQSIQICEADEGTQEHGVLLFWQVKPVVHVFQLSEEGPCEELTSDGQLSSFHEWTLPAKEFDGMWESLVYEPGLKKRLLRYAQSALLFTEKGVDPFLVSWNRIILLHGPPGTGKTSLCKALAQKLSIRFNSRLCQLIEVNAHSLFSKWFFESGKLVARLFQKIQEMVEEDSNLVFVLIDEVESLAAARKSALSGGQCPAYSDKLKASPNVVILTTSNITAAIDIAFVDRADIKAYVGPPALQARHEILQFCLLELIRAGILASTKELDMLSIPSYARIRGRIMPVQESEMADVWNTLLEAADACEGMSGRSLRKLPFLSHASLVEPGCCDPVKFLRTMITIAKRERSELPD